MNINVVSNNSGMMSVSEGDFTSYNDYDGDSIRGDRKRFDN